MSWKECTRGPIINARAKWQAQEHARRVQLLGEWLAEDWEFVVDEFADANGKISKERVLQLMEDTFKMGQRNAPLRTGEKREICPLAGSRLRVA